MIKQLDISPNEVVTIGNGINDLEMIESAGLGIAMENSPNFIKERADMVTKDNDHHGATYPLNEIFHLGY